MRRCISILFFLILVTSCSNNVERESNISEKSLDLQVKEAYMDGLKALEDGDVLFAAKKFNEVEILFPQSDLAPKSSLMAAYSYYAQDYYEDCIIELQRFLKIYPKDKNLSYAYYLLAVAYYEQIVDEKKDTFSILKAKEYFQYINKTYPNTEYSIDAYFKIELINDILAAKELYLGRYYLDKKKWIAAINRFKNVVDDYETTIYVEEALYRLVEVYYLLGLKKSPKNMLSYWVTIINPQNGMKIHMLFLIKYKKKEFIKTNEKNNITKKLKLFLNINE